MLNQTVWRYSLRIASLLLFAPVLLAQTMTSGDIAGTVTDPAGGALSEAIILLKNNGTGDVQQTKTKAQGAYRFTFLPPGSYTITVQAPNFMTAQKVVPVSVGQVTSVDVQLSIKTASTSIEVTAFAVGVQTDNGNLSTTITPQQLAELPNSGNDMTFYALITPGVTMSTNGGYGNFSTYGLPATSNTFTVNGAINNDVYLNLGNSGASNLMLGSNAIGEATVVNNGYTGQYGGLASSQVSYVSKSGTNAYHGNAIYYWNGRVMNANNWFNNQSGDPRPFSNVNEWATSAGGPFPKQKDKTFFFVDYEGTRIVLPTNVLAKIPSPQFENATIANLQATGQTQAVPFYQNIFHLYNGALGASNAVPVPGGGCGGFTLLGAGVPCALQFRSNQGNFTKEYVWSARVDHNITSVDRAFVQVQRDNGTQPTYTDPINPIFNAFSPQPQMNGQINYIHTFGPTAVNEFILTGQYYSARFGPPDINSVLGVFPTVIRFSPTLFSNMGGEGYNWPQGRRVTQYEVIDDFSKSWGVHSFKFGMNFHRINLTYLSYQTFLNGRITELSLADFYNGGGTANYLQQNFPQVTEAPFAYYNLGGYAQDEWRVTPKLTVTLTLRGDHNSNPVCQVNCFANLVAPFNSLVHDPNVPYNKVIQTNLHQALSATTRIIWQPRVGFAWTPFRKKNNKNDSFVVRGGFGIFGDVFPGQVAGTMATNTPERNSFLVNNGRITPGAPGNLFTTAAAANQSLLAGFASGGTVGSITATNPFFQLPNFTTMDNTYIQARYQEWNLEVQYALPWQLIASANYVGNHGIHEVIQNNGLNGWAPGFVGLPGAKPDTRFQTVTQYQTGAVSNYTGLVLGVRKQLAQGLQFGASYIYSHALDIVSNAGYNSFDLNTDPSILFPQNPYNIRQFNYGNADYDVRQYLSINYVWEDGIRRIVKKAGPNRLMGGWTFSGTLFWRTGQPFTVIDTAASGAIAGNGFGGPIFATPIVPGYNGCGAYAANPGAACLAISQFAPSTSSPTGFGNQTRNQYRGPGFFDTDLSIMKNFDIPWESVKFGVGFQFFNLFNHPNFDKPVNDIAQGLGTFGTIQALVSPPTSILGSFVGADASGRIIQLRAQFVF
jgi:Carboxypeptidase regulatory-like domain/TonB dependent receptor